jgi:hypothetical protein
MLRFQDSATERDFVNYWFAQWQSFDIRRVRRKQRQSACAPLPPSHLLGVGDGLAEPVDAVLG